MSSAVQVGERVFVPWGLDEDVEGTVVEVWGDPPTHVRVALEIEKDEEPQTLLLKPKILTRLSHA